MDSEQNLFLTQEEIDCSPSSKEGMSKGEEFHYRCFACEMIREGQLMLELYLIWTPDLVF